MLRENMATGYLVINDCPIIVSRRQSKVEKCADFKNKRKLRDYSGGVCTRKNKWSLQLNWSIFPKSILIKCWCRQHNNAWNAKKHGQNEFETNLLELAHKIISILGETKQNTLALFLCVHCTLMSTTYIIPNVLFFSLSIRSYSSFLLFKLSARTHPAEMFCLLWCVGQPEHREKREYS